jgi:hypothetical protein
MVVARQQNHPHGGYEQITPYCGINLGQRSQEASHCKNNLAQITKAA